MQNLQSNLPYIILYPVWKDVFNEKHQSNGHQKDLSEFLVMKNWKLRFAYSQEENTDCGNGADWHKEEGTSLFSMLMEVLVVISEWIFRLTIIKHFLSAKATKYFLILPKREQTSPFDFFIKKLKITCLIHPPGNIHLASEKGRLESS